MPDVNHADLHALSAELQQAIREAPLPSLAAGAPAAELIERLRDTEIGFPDRPPRDAGAAQACQAALWLLAGDLDQSHELSQTLETADGSFWHGVMHRREGDFGNAKYWFRRAGDHPAYANLAAALAEDPATSAEFGEVTGEGFAGDRLRWDPLHFVDQCEQAVRHPDASTAHCQQAQWIEWQVLFADCLHRAWPS